MPATIIELKKVKDPSKPILLGGDPVVGGWPSDFDKLFAAKAQGKRIYDFLPDIDSSEEEQAILKTWTDWFTFKKVPWAVTKGRVYKLWKIWEGLTDEEMRRINNAVSGKKGG